MKRFPKLIVTLLLLAMVIGIFAAIPVSAASDYEALKLKVAHLTAGHYTTKAMDGEIVQHSANKNYKEEIGCMIDNDNKGAYWSKPYKFKDFVDEGGSIVPVVLIDVAAYNNGSPLAVAAFDLRLRSSMDCRPTHVVLQATTSADSNTWVTLADKRLSDADWDASPKQRIEFAETTVYKFRFLAYNIGDADIAADQYKDYTVVKGDETRLALAEIDLLVKKEADEGGSTGGNTGSNTTNPTTIATRPVIQAPTRPVIGQTTTPTQAPTRAPSPTATQAATQAPTKAPTQPATQAPTKAPNQPATQAPTKAPNQPTTPVATQAPTTNVTTTEPTVAPTEPVVDPSAPTVEPTVDPSAPVETVDPSAPTETVDPSAPTEEPTEAPSEEATVAPTEEATEPEATEPTDVVGGEDEPKGFPWIIVAIAGAVVVAAGAVAAVVIIKKKRA